MVTGLVSKNLSYIVTSAGNFGKRKGRF